MEYVYAALILNETNAEINQDNLMAVLEAAGADVSESRVKALVAALEGVDIDEEVANAASVPAPAGGGGAPAAPEDGAEGGEQEVEEADEELPDTTDEEEEEASGEGLGDLFG